MLHLLQKEGADHAAQVLRLLIDLAGSEVINGLLERLVEAAMRTDEPTYRR
jgi:hypothetical protein